MTKQFSYGATARVLHWTVAALLILQYLLGWLMPNIHGKMTPGAGMTWHISMGSVILALIVGRFIWRLSHPVAPESSLRVWQRFTSEAVHLLLYVLVLLTTLSGWLFASARGWNVSWFFAAPMPKLTSEDPALVKVLDGWHQNFEWALLSLIGLHVAAAFIHVFYYRDSVIRRMLPVRP